VEPSLTVGTWSIIEVAPGSRLPMGGGNVSLRRGGRAPGGVEVGAITQLPEGRGYVHTPMRMGIRRCSGGWMNLVLLKLIDITVNPRIHCLSA